MNEPKWYVDIEHAPPDVERMFYGSITPSGELDGELPYVEIIRSSEGGVNLGYTSKRSKGWCYSYQRAESGWMELPPCETLEEAQAAALLLWRLAS